VKKQIKNIDGLGQAAILKHYQFFQHICLKGASSMKAANNISSNIGIRSMRVHIIDSLLTEAI